MRITFSTFNEWLARNKYELRALGIFIDYSWTSEELCLGRYLVRSYWTGELYRGSSTYAAIDAAENLLIWR